MKINIITVNNQNIPSGAMSNQRLATGVSFRGKFLRDVPQVVENLVCSFKLPCPYCAQPMLDLDTYARAESVLKYKNAYNFADVFRGAKAYLRGMSKAISDEILDEATDNSHEKLSQIALTLSDRHFQPFVSANVAVVRQTKALADELLKDRVQKNLAVDFFEKAIDDLQSGDADEFDRIEFMTKSGACLRAQGVDNALIERLLQQLRKLPSPTSNIDAFFVRNGRVNLAPSIFIQNLFRPSTSTVEHIVPLSKGGTFHPFNLIPACGKDNNDRGDMPFGQFVRGIGAETVLKNMQLFFERLPQGLDYEMYALGVKKTLKDQAGGALDGL